MARVGQQHHKKKLPCPSSGARDYDADYHNGRVFLDLLYVGG